MGDRPTKLLKILDDNDDLLKNIQTFYKDKESIANKNVVIEQIKTKIKSYRKSAIDPASQGEFLYWMAGLANKADLEEALLSQEQNAILKIRIKFDELTNLEEDFDYGPYTVSVENKKLYIQNGDRGIKLPLDKSLKNHINKRATAEVIAKYKKLFFIEDNKEKAERKERINELEINKKKLEDMKEPLIKPDYWDQYEKLIKAFKEWDHIENNKERPFHQNAGSGLTNADVVFQCLAEIRSLRDGIITRDNLVALKTIFVDTLTQDKKSIIRLKNGLEANASKKEPSLAKKIIDTLVLNRGNITAAIEKRLVINNFDVKPLLKNINLNDPSDDDGW